MDTIGVLGIFIEITVTLEMMVPNADSFFLIGPFNSSWKHKHMDA